jgi:hypothetical protein
MEKSGNDKKQQSKKETPILRIWLNIIREMEI